MVGKSSAGKNMWCQKYFWVNHEYQTILQCCKADFWMVVGGGGLNSRPVFTDFYPYLPKRFFFHIIFQTIWIYPLLVVGRFQRKRSLYPEISNIIEISVYTVKNHCVSNGIDWLNEQDHLLHITRYPYPKKGSASNLNPTYT